MISNGNIFKFSSLGLGRANASGLKDLSVLLRVAMVINPRGGKDKHQRDIQQGGQARKYRQLSTIYSA